MNTIETDTLTVTKKGTLPSVPFAAIKEKILGKRYTLSLSFVTPKKAQALNIQYRNKDYIPDTLSFPLSKTSGEIILCESAMKKEYKDHGMDYSTFLIFITIHSMLHLKGFDHGSTMESKEQSLLRTFTTLHTNGKTKHNRRH